MMTLCERALIAAAKLMEQVRTSNGWATECGALVRLTPTPVALDASLYCTTTVYESEEALTGVNGPVVRAGGMIQVAQAIVFDTATIAVPGDEGSQHQRIKTDHRKALCTDTGGLADATGSIGEIELVGSVLIAEFLASGFLIVRTTIKVHTIERWGNPAIGP